MRPNERKERKNRKRISVGNDESEVMFGVVVGGLTNVADVGAAHVGRRRQSRRPRSAISR